MLNFCLPSISFYFIDPKCYVSFVRRACCWVGGVGKYFGSIFFHCRFFLNHFLLFSTFYWDMIWRWDETFHLSFSHEIHVPEMMKTCSQKKLMMLMRKKAILNFPVPILVDFTSPLLCWVSSSHSHSFS